MKKHLLLLCCLFLSLSAWADHGQHGPFVSLGFGVNSTESSLSSTNNEVVLDSGSGLATSFRIGLGLGDHLKLYYVHDNSWYADINTFESKKTGIRGVGASYYLGHNPNPLYVMAALGTGVVQYPLVADESFEGTAAMLGIGFNLNDRTSIEANILGTSIPDNFPGETIDHFSSRIMLNLSLF